MCWPVKSDSRSGVGGVVLVGVGALNDFACGATRRARTGLSVLHFGWATVPRSGSDGVMVGEEGGGPEWVEGKPGTCLTAPRPLENGEGEVDGGDDMNATGSGALRERS